MGRRGFDNGPLFYARTALWTTVLSFLPLAFVPLAHWTLDAPTLGPQELYLVPS